MYGRTGPHYSLATPTCAGCAAADITVHSKQTVTRPAEALYGLPLSPRLCKLQPEMVRITTHMQQSRRPLTCGFAVLWS